MTKSLLIAISGGSGSGKTTLASLLLNYFSDKAILISQDSYYKDFSKMTFNEREEVNFDHPSSIDFDLLYKNIRELINGRSVNIPVYCFATHTRKSKQKYVEPSSVILFEGLFSLYDERISKLVDHSIYVDASDDIRLIRRIKRDSLERGRSIESVLTQYESTVRSMHLEFVAKQKNDADHVVYNNGDVDLSELGKDVFETIRSQSH